MDGGICEQFSPSCGDEFSRAPVFEVDRDFGYFAPSQSWSRKSV
jgi:hypothetical protein